MEIRTLRYFMAIAREGSLTKAGEYLHITQPTLSRAMRDLEQELGCELFIRKSRSLPLTEDGLKLRERAREILALVDKTESEFAEKDENITGDVYLGAAETPLMAHIAAIAQAVHERYPYIRFNIYSGNEETISGRLDSGLLDFGLLMEPANLSHYHHIPLPDTDAWGLMMRADHPLAAKKAVTPNDLMAVPLFVSRQATGRTHTQNIFSDWFAGHFDDLNIVGTFDLLTNTSAFVKQGMGCAFTVEGLMDLNEDRSLCFRPLTPTHPPLRFGLEARPHLLPRSPSVLRRIHALSDGIGLGRNSRGIFCLILT